MRVTLRLLVTYSGITTEPALLLIAHVTITSSIGTRRADDEACLILKDLEEIELATMFTSQQLDNFIMQLQQMKYALQERNDRRKGIK